MLSQIAPGRAADVSRVALSALFSGVLSTLTSASIAGMLYTADFAPAIGKVQARAVIEPVLAEEVQARAVFEAVTAEETA